MRAMAVVVVVVALLTLLTKGAVSLTADQKDMFDTDYVTVLEDDYYYYMVSDGIPQHPRDDSVNIGDVTAEVQDYNFTIPKIPTQRMAGTTCLPEGPIGITLWGRYYTVYNT